LQEQNSNGPKAKKADRLPIIIAIVAIAMVIYQLIYTQYLVQDTVLHLNTHLGFSLLLVFLATAQKTRGLRRYLSLFAVLLSVVAALYVQVFYSQLVDRVWFNTPLDLVIGLILIVLVLEATRESFGLVLPIVIIAICIYPFFGAHFPEPFRCTSLSFTQTISNWSIGVSGGIYGPILSVSANYIFLFIVFGGLLQAVGATGFFIQVGRLVGKRLRSGPGLGAVVCSSLLGMVTGSVAANIAVIGSFTIPLMKKAGYTPEEAGAIEAASSNGGQIMPPVMGITAFAMAAVTGIPYVKIAAMAIMPAILYYLSLALYVQLKAIKNNVMPLSEEFDKKEMLRSLPSFVVPLGIIIALLVMNFSVSYVAFWAVISTVVVSLLRKKGRPSLRKVLEGFVQGGKAGAEIGIMCGAVGLLVETFMTSGLGIKLAAGMESWSGGSLLLALLIIWAVCVLFGCFGPAMSAYIVVTIFAAPALMRLGIGMAQSHFFVMFTSCFAFVTPPVALGALMASRLSGSGYVKTAAEAVKVSFAAFLLPFMFIYVPFIILQPQEPLSAVTGLTACVLAIFSFQFAFVGVVFIPCKIAERLLWLAPAIFLFSYIIVQDYLLFGIGTILFIFLGIWHLRNRRLLSPVYCSMSSGSS